MQAVNSFSKEALRLLEKADELTRIHELSKICEEAIIRCLLRSDKDFHELIERHVNSTARLELLLNETLDGKALELALDRPDERQQEKLECILNASGETKVTADKFESIATEKLLYAAFIATEEERETIRIDDIIYAFMVQMSDNLKQLFLKSKADLEKIEAEIKGEEAPFELPEDMKDFARVLNDEFAEGEECPICGREAELEQIWTTMSKKSKRNAILLGKPGVGKSSIIYKLTSDIVRHMCPKQFEGFKVISLDVTSIIAGTKYRGDAEKRFKEIIDFAKNNDDVILFIDEIHMIVGAGNTGKNQNQGFSNALKPLLAGDSARIIGATTTEEYDEVFEEDGALRRRFQTIYVDEPSNEEVYPMLRESIKQLADFHRVSISKKMAEIAVLYSSCFNYTIANPDRTRDLIDLSMAVAKREGKERVTRNMILKNFESYFNRFTNMSKMEKLRTAYHEIGHYIMWHESDYLTDRKVVAVSIIPTEHYAGVNVFEDTRHFSSDDMRYFIDLIALHLAGRVAEKEYTDTFSAGASSDLRKATKVAYRIVARYGMSEFGRNRIYLQDDDYQMQSAKTIDEINEEIDNIIKKAYERAESVIKENKTLLDLLAEKLSVRGILPEEELETIVEEQKVEV